MLSSEQLDALLEDPYGGAVKAAPTPNLNSSQIDKLLEDPYASIGSYGEPNVPTATQVANNNQIMQEAREASKEPTKNNLLYNLTQGVGHGVITAGLGFDQTALNVLGLLTPEHSDINDFAKKYSNLAAKAYANEEKDYQKTTGDSIASGVGNIIGSSSMAMAGGGVGKAGTLANILSKGAIGGSLAGFTAPSSQDNGFGSDIVDRGVNAAGGAALGVAGSAIGNALSKVGGSIVNKLTDYVKNDESTTLNKSLSKIWNSILDDNGGDIDKAKKAIISYSNLSDKSLAEVGKGSTRSLAEGASIFPENQQATQDFANRVSGKAIGDLQKAIGENVSPKANSLDIADIITEKGQDAASPFYKEFYKSVPSMQSPMINKILDTPAGKKALGQAVKDMNNKMVLSAKPDPELTSLMREAVDRGKMDYSKGGVAAGLKPETLDYIKRGFDKEARKAYSGGDSAEGDRINDLKNGLLSEMDRLDTTGSYAKARLVASDYKRNEAAIEEGKNFLLRDPEVLQRTFKNYSAPEQESYKVGLSSSLLGKVAKAANDQAFNGNNGIGSVANIFKSQNINNKLQDVLKPAEYQSVMNAVRNVADIFGLVNRLTGNSRTAARQVAVQQFSNSEKQIALDILHKGAIGAAREHASKFLNRALTGLDTETAKATAKILFEHDPAKKLAIADALYKKAQGGDMRAAKALGAMHAVYNNLLDKSGAIAVQPTLQRTQ